MAINCAERFRGTPYWIYIQSCSASVSDQSSYPSRSPHFLNGESTRDHVKKSPAEYVQYEQVGISMMKCPVGAENEKWRYPFINEGHDEDQYALADNSATEHRTDVMADLTKKK